ncbi:MAG TPA: N-acetyltransferase [Vicinamibacterales bacterium]|nr:N-acetyltransferase [Vicinamibacterales bacterium]
MIRDEEPGDASAVRVVNQEAFGSPLEADIVDALRTACLDRLSLVAERDGGIVGHILFTPVEIATAQGPVRGYGLAPMAVRTAWQRQGIGSALIAAGTKRLREAGAPFVIVLGHPEYYPRFGFEPAARHGVRCQWPDVPDNAFMLLMLDPASQAGLAGIARYRPEFDAV